MLSPLTDNDVVIRSEKINHGFYLFSLSLFSFLPFFSGVLSLFFSDSSHFPVTPRRDTTQLKSHKSLTKVRSKRQLTQRLAYREKNDGVRRVVYKTLRITCLYQTIFNEENTFSLLDVQCKPSLYYTLCHTLRLGVSFFFFFSTVPLTFEGIFNVVRILT